MPELEDMEQRGYFGRQEIKQIVQKRQDFEYSLKRRAALKEDYLRWGCVMTEVWAGEKFWAECIVLAGCLRARSPCCK